MGKGREGVGWIVVVLVAALVGCGHPRVQVSAPRYDEAAFASKPIAAYVIPTPVRGVASETVVGEVRTYRIREGDTLIDVARYNDPVDL